MKFKIYLNRHVFVVINLAARANVFFLFCGCTSYKEIEFFYISHGIVWDKDV